MHTGAALQMVVSLQNGSSKRQPDMRALVVDDDLEIALLVQKILQSRGVEVVLAPNGREALCLARKESFDLIILDIMMPGVDGTSVLAELRRRPEHDGARIVMLTARGEPRDAKETSRIGADAYVTKPFTMNDLLKAIGSQSLPVAQSSAPHTERTF